MTKLTTGARHVKVYKVRTCSTCSCIDYKINICVDRNIVNTAFSPRQRPFKPSEQCMTVMPMTPASFKIHRFWEGPSSFVLISPHDPLLAHCWQILIDRSIFQFCHRDITVKYRVQAPPPPPPPSAPKVRP